MTPTASASPIVLLAPAIEPVKAPVNTDNSPAAALDGGFQLLIDAAAQQQLGSQLGSALAKGASAASGNGVEKTPDTGNVLPLASMLLAGATDQPALLEEDLDNKPTKDKDEASADAQPSDAAIQLLWAPINIQAPQPPPSSKGGATAVAGDTIGGILDGKGQGGGQPQSGASIIDGASVNPQASVTDKDIATPVDVATLAAGDNATASLSNLPPKAAAHNPNAANDLSLATPNTDAKIGGAMLNGAAAATAAATKATEDAGFADVLKPELAVQASGGATATAAVDSGRAPQAARPYMDMNTATATVSLPVGSSGWSDAVVDKVMWFSANQLSNAEIKLNPPDLGPLQVRISTQQDQASVVFSSPHAAVREALDQALPRLRDMLGGQGIQLSDASVGGQNASRQQQQGGDNRGSHPNFFRGDDNTDTPVAVTRVVGSRLSTSAVDAYA
jgi:flagellar hook-length control protein FliK